MAEQVNVKNDADAQVRSAFGCAGLCVCDPGWFGEIKPICGEFISDEGFDQCKNCEHCEACHKSHNVKLI